MHSKAQPSWIQKYVGLRFGDKGRGPDEFDCWGLVRWIYLHEFKILLPDYLSGYSTITEDSEVERTVLNGRDDGWIRVDKPEPGAAVLFNVYGKPIHIGIATWGDHFLHSPEDDFSRQERLSDRMWRNRIEGFYVHRLLSGRS